MYHKSGNFVVKYFHSQWQLRYTSVSMMAATKLNLLKTHAHCIVLTLMWYRVVSTKNFQHESSMTQTFPYLQYMQYVSRVIVRVQVRMLCISNSIKYRQEYTRRRKECVLLRIAVCKHSLKMQRSRGQRGLQRVFAHGNMEYDTLLLPRICS